MNSTVFPVLQKPPRVISWYRQALCLSRTYRCVFNLPEGRLTKPHYGRSLFQILRSWNVSPSPNGSLDSSIFPKLTLKLGPKLSHNRIWTKSRLLKPKPNPNLNCEPQLPVSLGYFKTHTRRQKISAEVSTERWHCFLLCTLLRLIFLFLF